MDLDLPSEAIEMQSATRRMVDDLLKLEPEFHRTGKPPAAATEHFKKMGLFGMGVPTEYGGLGLDTISSIAVQVELSRLPPQFWPLLRAALGPSIKTLVNVGTPGMTVSDPIPTTGWVQDGVFEVVFDNSPIPADNLLGEEGRGFTYFYKCLNEGRLSVGAQALGAASIALDHSVDYAKQRMAFGHPIADFQAVQHHLADMEVDVHLSRLMLMEAAWQFQQGRATGRTCSRVKLFCSEAAGRVADRGVQIHGGSGYCRGMIVERVYRDVRVLRIYDGTSEIHRNIIAKELLR